MIKAIDIFQMKFLDGVIKELRKGYKVKGKR